MGKTDLLSGDAENGVYLPFRDWPLFLFLGALGFLTIAGCLSAPLIFLDDPIYISSNPLLNPDNPWWRVFTEVQSHHYIPISQLSYRLNAALFGLDAAWGYRVVSWAVHVASAGVLLRILGRLGMGRSPALFVSAAWVVHPMACESVAWVSERGNVLSFFWGSLALLCYLGGTGRAKYAGGLVCYALALLSKPLALGWLGVFIALELVGGAGHMVPGRAPVACSRMGHVLRLLARLVPYVVISGVIAYVGCRAASENIRTPPGGGWFAAALTDSGLYLRYVFNTVLPVRLSAMYTIHEIESLADVALWKNLLAWVLLFGVSIYCAASRRRVIFGWLWFLGALAPASNLIAIGYPMQDRYIYLSSVGVLIVVAEVACGLAARANAGWMKWAGLVLASVYLGGLSFWTVERSEDWADSVVLMREAVACQPDGALPRIFYARQLGSLAGRLRRAGREEEARTSNLEAIRQIEAGMAMPDAHLFNPIYAAVLRAGYHYEAGATDRAIAFLEGRLPLPVPEKKGDGGVTYRFVAPADAPECSLSRGTISVGYQYLAQSYLQEFLKTQAPREVAKEYLNKAIAHSTTALKAIPSADAQCVRAWVFVVQEAFSSKEFPPDQALSVARERGRLVGLELTRMCYIDEISAELESSALSLARIRALAYLGMAHAYFEKWRSEEAKGPATDALLMEALRWAQQAAEVPTHGFAEGYWYLARIHHVLLESAQASGDTEKAEVQRQICIKLLEQIPQKSPRFTQAQSNLRLLQAKP